MISSVVISNKKITTLVLVAVTAFSAVFIGAPNVYGKVSVANNGGNLGVIKGIVRDEAGNTIADAYVSIFRLGTSKLLKQVRSASDGSFLAKMMPGTYTVLAVAEGFNAVTLSAVEVNRSAELIYGFKLERAGIGNTLPEKRVDRESSKWRIRAAQMRRTVYQNTESDVSIDENDAAEDVIAQNDPTEENVEIVDESEPDSERQSQTIVETYFAASNNGNLTGVNFATLQPISENSEIIIAGQSGTNRFAPQRLETTFRFRPNEKHQISLKGSAAKLGAVEIDAAERTLGQVSVQALDEWKIRSGVILVLGFDYSKFVGAGDDSSLRPRFGLQFDADSRTRIRSAYTTAAEERTWASVADLEESQVLFRAPVSMTDFAVENKKPRMNKNSRLEFGIERILDDKSSVEANVFFDTVSGRGIGLTNLPFESIGGENLTDFVVNQQGRAQGLRIVYSRRLSGRFSTSAGYAFGSGQKLSGEAISNPANVLENDFFQTLYGQFDADFKTGTQVKTIFRLSPQATIFAIDPFAGRMAIYDPSLSVMVTQSLPNLGLPFRAQAVLDGRNLFDFQTGAVGEEGTLRLNSQKRMLRGGILVRF